MKQLLSLFAVGMLGVVSASAQTTASGQAGTSAQAQTSVQKNNAGAQASGSELGICGGSGQCGK